MRVRPLDNAIPPLSGGASSAGQRCISNRYGRRRILGRARYRGPVSAAISAVPGVVTMGAVAVVPRAGPFMNEITGPPRTGPVSTLRDSQNIARPPNLRPAIDRRQAPRTAKSPQAARSVAHLPELLSRTHRNRVRKLSPGNRNSDVHDQPGSHKRDPASCPRTSHGQMIKKA